MKSSFSPLEASEADETLEATSRTGSFFSTVKCLLAPEGHLMGTWSYEGLIFTCTLLIDNIVDSFILFNC